MGVSLSNAPWFPSLQARRSLVTSPARASSDCAAMAYLVNYTAAESLKLRRLEHDPLGARSAPTRKGGIMKRIAKITLFIVGMAVAATMGFKPLAELRADNNDLVSVDVACDCRTGVNLDGGGRAAPFMIEGKIFPPGTLAS